MAEPKPIQRWLFQAFWVAAFLVAANSARAVDFMAGADISALTVLEDAGAIYRDNGQPGDLVEMFQDHGVNWFRLRLFVDPSNSQDDFVVNDLAYTIDLAKRAKAAGGKVLLDFHYSDTWADPGKQYKPAAWTSLNYSQLQQQVYSYTKSSIEAFKAEGVLPEMVQIGNEISNGMLWNSPNAAGSNSGHPWTGGSHNTGFDRLAGLLTSGINGAKDGAGPGQEPLIMIHHDKGAEWSMTEYYFDKLVARNVDFDVIGYSYYPKFHYTPSTGDGGISDVIENLNNTANKYGKPVVIAEAGFASRGTQFEPDYEFDVSVAGQQAYMQALVDAVQNVPNDLGWGLFWWYADARPVNGLSVWEGGRYGLFDASGNLLPTIDVFEQFIPPLLPGDFNEDGFVDAADYTVWQDEIRTPAKYELWKLHFGEILEITASSAGLTAVPEPSLLAMWMMGLGMLIVVGIR